MGRQGYFYQALSDFTFEAACGGEIRHFAGLGYTVKQIVEALSVPVPFGKVQQAVWAYLVDTRILLLEEPGGREAPTRPVFVREYDKYGKASFRKVNVPMDSGREKTGQARWKERTFHGDTRRAFAELLSTCCNKDSTPDVYLSCSFGLPGQGGEDKLACLQERQRDYILGLPWSAKTVYHRLTPWMREIAAGLYGQAWYHESIYLLGTEEKITF